MYPSNRSGTSHTGEAPRFSRPTLEQYAETILAEAGITGLAMKNLIFRQDPGIHLDVVLRGTGGGYDFFDKGSRYENITRAGWLVFEKLPGSGADYLRARVFDTFAGACTEFATKLIMQSAGNVTIRELAKDLNSSHRGRNLYVAFEGMGQGGMCSMLLAPASTALDTATRLFLR